MELNFFTIILLSFGIGGLAVVVGFAIVKYKDLKQAKEIFYDVDSSSMGMEIRKANEQILKKNKIQYDKTLPMFLYDHEYSFKDKESILKRALCLFCIVDYAKNYDKKETFSVREKKLTKLKKKLKSFSVSDELTEKEKELIENPTVKLAKKIAWKQECLYVLCWALGLIENIDLPFEQSNFEVFENLFNKKAFKEILDNCTLRTKDELITQNDLHFLCQWVCNEESYVGKRISKLNIEVTNERFRASSWLVTNQTDWDRVDLSA